MADSTYPATANTTSASTTTVAIIGGGPRGLWATEELLAQAAVHPDFRVAITVFNAPSLEQYATDQPNYWRLNVQADYLRTATLGEFGDWAGNYRDYLPRALAGKFLEESWANLAIPENASVTIRDEFVADPYALARDFDEVLLVRGHAETWSGELDDALTVYPAGSLDTITPGSTVTVRGLSLTFMDAVLDLTLGRGGGTSGGSTSDGNTSNSTTGSYHASGNEPAAIHPYSRSGRFLAVKPEDHVKFDLKHLRATHSGAISRAKSAADIMEAIINGAQHLSPKLSRNAIDAVIDDTDSTGDAAEDFRRDFAVATGAIAPTSGDPATAGFVLAESFRAIYPALVNKLSFTDDFADFSDYMSTLDRVIYGLPPVNARILIQLFDAGIVTTDTTVEKPADFIVDAIIPPAAKPPLKTLRNARLSADSNIAAAGRVTEGWIHGNDTLSRDYHEVIPNWAFDVCLKATSA